MPNYSQAYIAYMTAGPFPKRVDPWSEAGRYFNQLHSEVISHMLGQIRMPLLQMGYVAGRETSLQIANRSLTRCTLVTVIEMVSPRNKNDHMMIRDYQARRGRLMGCEVNIVEIDLTCSVKRLIDDPLVKTFHHHVAVHLYDQPPRLIGMALVQYRFAVKLCVYPRLYPNVPGVAHPIRNRLCSKFTVVCP